jgi:hypothetical protein
VAKPTQVKASSQERRSEPSNSPEIPLRDLQTWFQTFLVAPGSTQDAVLLAQQASNRPDLSPIQLIMPSDRLTPQQRLLIYRDQYLLRMDEAMSIDYPVLQQAIGEQAFFELVSAYVEVHPSRSYTLNDLGRHLPEFLANLSELRQSGTAQPDGRSDKLKGRWLQRLPLLTDLSKIEWALCELMGDPDVKSLSADTLRDYPIEQWPKTQLKAIPALRALKLDYPVQRWLNAHRDEEPLPLIRRRPTYLVCWRIEDDIWRQPLSQPEFILLQLLLSGVQVGDAMDQVLAQFRVSPPRLFAAFTSWLGDGLFSEIL